jgi:hypothetical protein
MMRTMNGRVLLLVLLACLAVGFVSLLVAGAAQPGGNAGSGNVAPTGNHDDDEDSDAGGGNDEDADGDDDEDGDDDKVCLCHNGDTICVGRAAVCAHVAHGDDLGPCTTPCGGETGSTCGEGQFCQTPAEECLAEGECVDLPPVCPSIFAPVCGCDSVTYSSACFANVAGVSVAHEGACEEGSACGGTAGDTCGEAQFCKLPEGACSEKAEGVCTDLPAACPVILAPVCGCDGTTYDNACVAATFGVSIDHAGECEGSAEACGGTTGVVCGEGSYCKRPDGECAEDAEGVCTPTPGICQPIILQVCGCDGTTYDNACVAAGLGISVDHEGECAPAPAACGGSTGVTCGEGSFCERPVGECTDETEGVCTAKPQACPVIVAPVCGCDGLTYQNDCLAAAAGVGVSHVDACPPLTLKSLRTVPRWGGRR